MLILIININIFMLILTLIKFIKSSMVSYRASNDNYTNKISQYRSHSQMNSPTQDLVSIRINYSAKVTFFTYNLCHFPGFKVESFNFIFCFFMIIKKIPKRFSQKSFKTF